MSLHNSNLADMVGRVRMFRSNVSEVNIIGWLNDRVRQAIDRRPYWADLLRPGVLSVPSAYNTGTVSAATGSEIVTGVATAWPVNDVINTTIIEAVIDYGYVEVTPVLMTGMAVGQTLYVDTGASAEAVQVIEVKRATIVAKFTKSHTAGTTATSSSLVGRQFRFGSGAPIFTIRSVHSATELELTTPWGGDVLTGSSYEIVKMYYVLGSDVKDILVMVDQQVGRPIALHMALGVVNWRDPQRMQSGPPEALVDLMPDESGNMQYELWPRQSTARQLGYVYVRQWPELVDEMDRPPHFINPSVFIHGAIADALRFKRDAKDPFHNPALAMQYEQRFEQGMMEAMNADESKVQRAWDFNYRQVFGSGGANFWASHDPDLNFGSF